MPLRPVNREQAWLLPPALDELLAQDHPARFVAAFVDGLPRDAWLEMEIDLDGDPLGAPAYHPRVLLNVWLYGFMTGIRSSRKLEVACREQIPFLWLTGWQHPDHNTLWRFYQTHRQSMRWLLKCTVRTVVEVGRLDLAVQAVDGTKVAASAAGDQTCDMARLEKLLARTEDAGRCTGTPSTVARTSFMSWRWAPSTANPTGIPWASVNRLRLTPDLPRSVGLGPVSPPKGALVMAPSMLSQLQSRPFNSS